ncbi:unnamed protein product [Phytophthora fragariaefolia]|uniref:Unnamed protein product n=1 Tax=Phytophthora fragariaefolia TaxID=1490495 RepID=A0A9W6XEZ6_9STRA|nr:unnamed protein product [Phytophthora fragariaefolia]
MSLFGKPAPSTPCVGLSPFSADAGAGRDDASEPFGRVENTQMCFARNGARVVASKWTPPPPPSRPLFGKSAFGYSSQPPKPLFGSSGANQVTVSGGGFTFGSTAASAPTSTSSAFGFGGAGVGFGGATAKATSAEECSGFGGFSYGFGGFCGSTATTMSATNTNASSGFGSASFSFGGNAAKPTSSSSFGSAGCGGDSFGFSGNATNPLTATNTVFGTSSNAAKPPLAPSSNPFTTSPNLTRKTTRNPFATIPANPFMTSARGFSIGDPMIKQAGTSASNPFAMKTVLDSTSNPFAMAQSSNSTSNLFTMAEASSSTSNPFAMKQVSSSRDNPFAAPIKSTSQASSIAARVSPNATVNPFSAPKSDLPIWSKNPFGTSAPAWSAGNASWSSKATAGSASLKFKNGLRPVFRLSESPWSSSMKELTPNKPTSISGIDWSKKSDSVQLSVESPFKMQSDVVGEATCTTTSTFACSLVASPNSNPYGSGSFGAGLVEQKVKAAIANPPSSVELKILDARPSHPLMSRQQPSARYAAKLGLARQASPVRPVQARFANPLALTKASIARAKFPQLESFQFSSSFSRLTISKRALKH